MARATADNTVAEGGDATEPTGDSPTRSNNATAIYRRIVKVSGTQEAVRVALPGSVMEDEKKIKLMRLKADMEYGLLNGSFASGASGTARGMAGIVKSISTNLTARLSGTSFFLTELEDLHQSSWDAVGGEGFVADVLLVPMGIKRKIATFTTRVIQNTDSTDHIYNDVDLISTSAGMLKVVPHKDVPNATGSTHVIAIKQDLFRMAFLKGREPKFVELSKTGDAERGMYITELTLESLAERASVVRLGYALTG
ncbi:MAG: DUF5309 family protein [Patescibacteria group bacterium]